LIQKLSKEKFSLILFRFPGQEDHLSRSMHAAADEVVTLPRDIRSAREKIAQKRLDVLFYPELGMDALTYFIAFSRLAPVQCKRGFQITMGIPNIDYFVSSDAAEPADAQEYYSETLVRLKGSGYYYYRPEKPKRMPDRELFGLPEGRTLYVCPQSLFKLHPDFDPVLSALLKKDSNGIIVLLEGLHPQWKAFLMKRFERTIPDAHARILFIPRQTRETFLNLYLLADAVIDTTHFSGGHTTLECFAWGIPVVTWPSTMLPGRLTYGFYKQMGVLDCVAWDQSSYVSMAHRLAHDLPWRDSVGRKILEKSPVLFENIDDVVEMETFFENALKTASCNRVKTESGINLQQ
jgi:predicted O-linked N-acetylglucosamine transferase (SPINDLY family)